MTSQAIGVTVVKPWPSHPRPRYRKGAGPRGLSGAAYLPAKIKEGDGDWFVLPIWSRRDCKHVTTLCLDCWKSWSWDYHLNLAHTLGGRELAIKVGVVVV